MFLPLDEPTAEKLMAARLPCGTCGGAEIDASPVIYATPSLAKETGAFNLDYGLKCVTTTCKKCFTIRWINLDLLRGGKA